MKAIQYSILCAIFVAGVVYGFGPFSSSSYLTPTATPEQSIYISWNTQSEESTAVAYGTTVSMGDTVRLTGIRYYHHVELTGLTPGQQYYYQVLPTGTIEQFSTFPVYSSTFDFVAFGDTRSDSVAHQSVIDRILDYPSVLSMHTGDLVNDGNNEADWRIYFNVEDTIIRDYHLVPAIGNHESPFWPYDTLFPLPGMEDYYSIEYGNTHYTILNTEMELYGDQRAWLISDLDEASNDTLIDWIFVGFHRPPYSSGNHGSQIDVRDAWCSLLEQYNVDIVFNGHDHDYERTIPINGVVYIVTGGGGAPLRHVGSNSWTAYSESTYHFCHININELVCRLRAIQPDGTVFDSLIIDKTIGVAEMDKGTISDLTIEPNPFSQHIQIQVYNGDRSDVQELKVYDITGTIVRDLADEINDNKPMIIWDGSDNSGQQVTSGVYYITYRSKSGYHTHKVVKINR
jgi:hypothetical protein